ncbi:MAG: aminotransferase class I/II-fold pyridoxal phosphate-dependent enzyme, partial [Ilumatobacteraceae bacterium]
MTNTGRDQEPETKAVTAGRDASGALSPALWASSTWDTTDVDGTNAGAKSVHASGFYSRYGNPTVQSFEHAIAELEGTEAALAFGSGMGAIASTIFALCSTGDHIVAQRN